MKDCRVSIALWEISMNKGYNFNNNRTATRNLSFADAQKIRNQRDLKQPYHKVILGQKVWKPARNETLKVWRSTSTTKTEYNLEQKH